MNELDNKEKTTKNTRKNIREEKKKKKKINKELKNIVADKQEIIELRKKRYILEATIIVIIAIIMLILLCNKTFFSEKYETSSIKIDIPLLTFFIKDDGKEIILKTLRKSDYLKDYFDAYLSNLDRYNCGENKFYYDTITKTAIYDISIQKTFGIKTISIKYQNGDEECLCNTDGSSC